MKLVFKALLAAAAIQFVYYGAQFAVGYVKTITYRPNMDEAWNNVEQLEQQVAFSYTASLYLPIAMFIVLAVICYFLLLVFQKTTARQSPGLLDKER